MKNARIVIAQVGVKTYYYAQIQMPFLCFFKSWRSIAYVFMGDGRVSWYRRLGDYKDAQKALTDYEELFGEKLNLIK